MDSRHVVYGETGLAQLEQELRASGQPQNIVTLTERYLEILRELVLTTDREPAQEQEPA